jgi:HEAT repeat protein
MSDSFSRSIRAQLRSVDEDIRHAALTQLHENLDRIEIEASELHPLLEDEDASFRWLTVQVLAELGEVESIPALLAATADRESDVAESAREALREFRTRDAIDAFLAGLDHPQAAVRAASVEALGRLKNTRALPGLRRAAEDLSDAVRREAIVALSQFQDARTLSQLRWGLYDHSAAVRQAAVTAIATVGPLTTANPSALARCRCRRPAGSSASAGAFSQPGHPRSAAGDVARSFHGSHCSHDYHARPSPRGGGAIHSSPAPSSRQ